MRTSPSPITDFLVAHARSIDCARLPSSVLSVARQSLLDWSGVTLAGAHEPLVMKLPLLVLATLAVAGGFMGIPQFIHGEHADAEPLNMIVAVTSVFVALTGIAAGWFL